MIGLAFFVVGLGAIAYAVFTQYKNTLPGDSAPKRVWASVVLAAASVGAAIMAWAHNITGP